MSENMDDITDDKRKDSGDGRGAAGKAADGAKKTADTAQKMKKAGMAVKLVSALWIVAFIVVGIFLVIGAYSFIVTLPGMMIDKITETVGGFFDSLQSFFVGNGVHIKDSDQTELANYINNMGYDVVGYGFAPSTNIKLAKRENKNDEAEPDDEITSQYLKAYLLADYNTYATSGGFIDDVGTFLGEAFGAKVLKGMLVFEAEDAGLDFSIESVDRKSKTITFKTWNPKLTDWLNGDTYRFNLDGWTGRYGKPLEFLLTLHISTMAPDLAYKLASGDDFDTKVHIGYETVDAWITTRYSVKAETVDNLKELEKNDDTKNNVIWNVEGLEYLKDKIANDGTLSLDKETLDKIKKILEEKPDEFEPAKNAFECLKGWNDYFKDVSKRIDDGSINDKTADDELTILDIFYSKISNTIEWTNSSYPGADNPPLQTIATMEAMTEYMNQALKDAEESGKEIKFNKEPEYYTDIISDLQEYDRSIPEKMREEYHEVKEKGENVETEELKTLLSGTKNEIDKATKLLDEIYKNALGYNDENGKHVDGDLEILNKNSEDEQKTRSQIEKALLEIGLTQKAIEEATDINKEEGGQAIKAVQPRILYTSKAWYRNVYFVLSGKIINGDSELNDDEYIQDLRKQYPNIKNDEVIFNAYVTKNDTKVPLDEYVFEPGEGTKQEDMKGIDGKGDFLISEMRNSSTTQSEQPKLGEINRHTKELFVGSGNKNKNGTNPKPMYYIYDGSEETAKEIENLKKKVAAKEIENLNGKVAATDTEDLKKNIEESALSDSEIDSMDTKDVYREIDMNKNSLAAFSILENAKTEDADFILRDLKDLLIELKYFKRSDLEDQNVGVLDWIIPAYMPEKWPERPYEKQNYEYGTYIKYRENILQGSNRNSADLDVLKISDTDAWNRLTNGKLSARPTEYEPSNRSSVQKEVKKKIVPITVKIRTWSGSSGLGKTDKEVEIQVNEELKEVWESFFEDVYNEATDFVISEYGGYRIDGTGTGQVGAKSAHEYGAAVDLNWSQNAYGVQPLSQAEWSALPESRAKYETIYIGSKVVEIAHKYTLSWGGDWTSCKDNMHFSFFGDESRDTLIQKWGNGIVVNRDSSNAKSIKSMDQVLIIGDQFVQGLKDSGKLSECKIEAENNSTPSTWLGKVDSLPTEDIKGVTVLLGGNDPSQIEQMKQLISKLTSKYSDGEIFVQKVFPVAEKYSGATSKNEAINKFNEAIEAYCEEQEHVTFIDTTKKLVDNNGFLVDLATDDGYVLNNNGYEPWAENIENKVLGSVIYAQEAIDFENQEMITPGPGKVVEVSDKSITIEFTQNNVVKGMTMKISGFDVDDNIKAGDELELKQPIGKTLKEDILLLLRTANKSVIENVEDYMPAPEVDFDEEKVTGFVENPPGTDVERWRDIVVGALAELGLDTSDATVERVLQQIVNESGGDPYSVNDYDSNSSFDCSAGVLQAIAACYNTYKRPGDPPATAFTGAQYRAGNYDKNDPRFIGYYCIYACINYCAQRYGRDLPVWPGGGY